MAHMVVIIRSHLGNGMWDFGQVHPLAGAKGVRRREFWPSIVPDQHTLLPFQGVRVSVRPARAQVWSVEVLGQEGVVTTSISVMCVWVCFFVLSDVRPGYCYTALANGRCSNQLPQSITKMQCCCDAGRCWSPGVTVAPEMCPIRATGKSPSGYLQRIPAPPQHKPSGNVHEAHLGEIQVREQDSGKWKRRLPGRFPQTMTWETTEVHTNDTVFWYCLLLSLLIAAE